MPPRPQLSGVSRREDVEDDERQQADQEQQHCDPKDPACDVPGHCLLSQFRYLIDVNDRSHDELNLLITPLTLAD